MIEYHYFKPKKNYFQRPLICKIYTIRVIIFKIEGNHIFGKGMLLAVCSTGHLELDQLIGMDGLSVNPSPLEGGKWSGHQL